MTLAKSDLQAIDKIFTKRIQPLEKGQTNLEKGQRKIKKDLKTIINGFDTEYLGLKNRVITIESNLGIQPPEF